MGELFHVADGGLQVLRPVPFQEGHTEEDLQRWADANPHFLNNGLPMLSLGTEIVTHHGHSIDNLYLDGNGHLVVAELKRGKSPRNVTAQVLDYGAYASRLDWLQIDAIWQKRHETDLDEAYRTHLGQTLDRSSDPRHRLLIVAETFEPIVEDTAAYLINTGVDLALLAFTYFELGETKLFDVRVVVGEIPEQTRSPTRTAPSTETGATEGYRNWLSRAIRAEFPGLARAHGMDVSMGRGEQYLNFIPEPWPYPIGDCRFSISINVYNVGIYFSYLNDRVPPELYAKLRQRIADPDCPYDAARLSIANKWTTLSHSIPLPEMGHIKEVRALCGEAFRMADTIAPLVRGIKEETV